MNPQWYLVMLLMLFSVAIALIAVCIYRQWKPEPMKPLDSVGESTEETEPEWGARKWH